MSRPRVLLLMSPETYRAGDFIKGAEAAGVDVVVATRSKPALADTYPDRYLPFPFNDLTAARAAVSAFHARLPIDAVVAIDDEGVIPAAGVADVLGLRHNTVGAARITRDKAFMRRTLSDRGVPSPWYMVFDSAADLEDNWEVIQFPCVVKPLTLSGSLGVIRANDKDELISAARRIEVLLAHPELRNRLVDTAGETLLVEEYLPGAEFAVEGLLEDGALRVLALFDKPDPLEGPAFAETIYVTPSRAMPDVQEAIRVGVTHAAKALGLTWGPLHAEVRVNDGGVWVIDVAARTIGGLCARCLRFGTGMSLEEILLRQACNLPIETLERERVASGVMMIPVPSAGVFEMVDGVESARTVAGIEDIQISIAQGTLVAPLPDSDRYVGFIFARATTPDEVEVALRDSFSRLEIVIRPAGETH